MFKYLRYLDILGKVLGALEFLSGNSDAEFPGIQVRYRGKRFVIHIHREE